MKNKKLRNSLIALVSAVFAGVLILGVSVAMGDAPGYNPPGSGVSPVFSGLTVNGTLNTNNATLNGSLTGGDLNVDSVVTNGNISAGVDLNAGRDLNVTRDLDVGHDIEASGSLSVDGNIGSVGWISSNSYLNSFGDIYAANDSIVGGDLTVDGSIGLFYDKNFLAEDTGFSFISCTSGHYLIDCAGWVSDGAIDYIYNVGNFCYVASSNPTADVRAYAKCFSTDGHL